MKYITLNELSSCVRRNIYKVPHDIDFVIGVPKEGGVGNGGLCLRRIEPFIDICKTRQNTENLPEDWFFCVKCADALRIAPVPIASQFSLEICPAAFYYKYGEILPMGCHKPYAYSYERFWKGLGVPNIR